MKRIIWKELRENLKWSALGMVIFSVALIYGLSELTRSYNYESYKSICSPILLVITTIGCAVMGATLGLLQTLTELRSRDQWAFLIHRPVHRKTIFRGKTVAGILLYLGATLLPFSATVWWVSRPGRIAAPFDWRMSLAGYADILAGITYYFGGMLTGLRQARWFGSRTLVLGLPIVCSLLVVFSTEFAEAAIWTIFIILISIVAVEGAFQTTGVYRSQNQFAKFALGFILLTGNAALVGLLLFSAESLAENHSSYSWNRYAILKDGKIVLEKEKSWSTRSVFTLDGKPLNLPKEELVNFYRQTLPKVSLKTSRGYSFRDSTYRSSSRFFSPIFLGGQMEWFYVFKKGLFFHYDLENRKVAGVMGPKGLSSIENTSFKPFNGPLEKKGEWEGGRVFRFPQSVYWVDTLQEKVLLLYSTNQIGDILGAAEVGDFYWRKESGSPKVAAVATTDKILFFSSEGKPSFDCPYHYKSPYDEVQALLTPKGDRYFLWYDPVSDGNGDEDTAFLPSYVVELNETGQVVQQYQLPSLNRKNDGPTITWREYIAGAGIPFAFEIGYSIYEIFQSEIGNKEAKSEIKNFKKEVEKFLCIIIEQISIGFLFSIVTLRRARKYPLEVKYPWLWAATVFLTGISGLLTFLCIREWPAKETCVSCGKKRAVNNDRCEHCGNGFPAPARDVAEIFEPHLIPPTP